MLSSYTFILFVWQSNTKSSILLMSNEWIVFLKYGPVAQTGRALPLQGRGPGFKSRWVHFYSYVIIFAMIFICAAPFRCGLCVKE